MKTPIVDFVRAYAEKEMLRFHMPGHKGKPFLSPEPYDITEIQGADALYEASGIIRESAGTHFDPDVAAAFLRAEDKVREVSEQFFEA